MRAAFIFCLSLFLFLAKGNHSAHATAPRISQGYNYLNENPKEKRQQTPFHKNANVHIQKSYSSIEVTYLEESTDEDNEFSRKSLAQIKAIYFCYSFLLGYFNTDQKLALPYCKHLSYHSNFKYILLSVFRLWDKQKRSDRLL